VWSSTSERDSVWMRFDFYVAINVDTAQHNLRLTFPFLLVFIAHSHRGRFHFTGHCANKPQAPQMSFSLSCR